MDGAVVFLRSMQQAFQLEDLGRSGRNMPPPRFDTQDLEPGPDAVGGDVAKDEKTEVGTFCGHDDTLTAWHGRQRSLRRAEP